MFAENKMLKSCQLKAQLSAELKSANRAGSRQTISSSLPSNKQHQTDKAVYFAQKQGSFKNMLPKQKLLHYN